MALLPKKSRKKRNFPPIPFRISFELAFIEEGLTEEEYTQEVRKIVRQHLPDSFQDAQDRQEAGFWEEYDDRISEIIEQELSRN